MIGQHSMTIGSYKVTGPLEIAEDGSCHGNDLATWERNAALTLLVKASIVDATTVLFTRKAMGMRKSDLRLEDFSVEAVSP